MRADNRGEGGILALVALVGQHETTAPGPPRPAHARPLRRRAALRRRRHHPGHQRARRDGGAHGGGARAARARWCRPPWSSSSALFLFQKRGTATVGAVFGPVMLLWFACIAATGAARDRARPARSCGRSRPTTRSPSSRTTGAGLPRAGRGGAGHHRRRGPLRRHGPLRAAAHPRSPGSGWPCRRCCSTTSARGPSSCATPSGARTPSTCWRPRWALYPLVAIATAAAIVASQALISRRLLAHQPGGAARLLAARHHPPHLQHRATARSTSPR